MIYSVINIGQTCDVDYNRIRESMLCLLHIFTVKIDLFNIINTDIMLFKLRNSAIQDEESVSCHKIMFEKLHYMLRKCVQSSTWFVI